MGPNLISQDLRYNALPLYFSRPLRRIDYFVGKLGVIVALLGMVIIVPAVVAYVLGLLFSLDITIRPRHAADSPGQRGVWIGGRRFGRAADARALVAVAEFAVRRAVLAGHLDCYEHRVVRAHQGRSASSDFATKDCGIAIGAALQFLESELEAAKSDWRPLISYTANLSRIEEHLLGTRMPRGNGSVSCRRRASARTFLLQMLNTQYPWYWSAGVLAGLGALSACILNRSIKSLDRLK